MGEATMNADLWIPQELVAWVVVEEEDWSGVYDCGAIFRPNEPMLIYGDRDDWPIEQCS
jgi:hypothetical protein